uniref:Uncharacterized protein n=1 Tax=Helianthus annuus TaxID=4232 RepID=A0A251TQ25_HELAN
MVLGSIPTRGVFPIFIGFPLELVGRFLQKSRKIKGCGRDYLKNHHQASETQHWII